VAEARQRKLEIIRYLSGYEAAHSDIASACEGGRSDSAAGGRVSDCGVSPGHAKPGPVDRGVEAPQVGAARAPAGEPSDKVSPRYPYSQGLSLTPKTSPVHAYYSHLFGPALETNSAIHPLAGIARWGRGLSGNMRLRIKTVDFSADESIDV
jgi:hypothetical protein